ncbi:SunI/YnzG family protein [Paenibacillus sp. QZ-Y1]|uniref:SunI/YnzG family protein n=1 Tax=Paenibacillus sp. QZ-Y1 TaxID=3414511 RepID=UPI003F7ABA90
MEITVLRFSFYFAKILVTLDDTYGGIEISARIGAAYGTSERILIRTTNQSYILFTSNETLFLKISAMVSNNANMY